MIKTTVLVTGANGQLGNSLKEISKAEDAIAFVYVDIEELDLVNTENVNAFFENQKFDYCVNCAAYTAVDKAEEDKINAEKVNSLAVKNLAEACLLHDTTLIHISTDFVFDGTSHKPYNETDSPSPISVYGKTKLEGEAEVTKKLKKHFTIRTAWLYSEFGNNFVKTMLKLGEQKDQLSIICDQIGSPTYARDLAKVVLYIIKSKNNKYGLYHYSNEGVASWYDFTYAIFDIAKKDVKLNPIPTEDYPAPAKRPPYSVLDKRKIKTNLGIDIPHWKNSLEYCIKSKL